MKKELKFWQALLLAFVIWGAVMVLLYFLYFRNK
jgi:hypothetical protein